MKPRNSLLTYAQQLCRERLSAYIAAPHDAEEHANIELSVLAGGYAYRQVAELVQNAADAIAETGTKNQAGRIVIKADRFGLWSANTGAPVDEAGVKALLNAHASGKRAGQIGRFGLGFKSLLRLGGRIDVLSRDVCLRFDPEKCRRQIRDHLGLAPGSPAPGLRIAEPSVWSSAMSEVDGASQFDWATTIVFAELVSRGAREAVIDEIRKFPAEFLLFLSCDIELVLEGGDANRILRRRSEPDGTVIIEDLAADKPASQRWRVFSTAVKITDQSAIDDATSVHAREVIPLIWAAPVDAAREMAGRFFAFFPTTTETRTLGILNAPWKLNSDRTALIPGAWNAALMEKAAELIVERLPQLSTDEDPGAVLDAFPRDLQTQSEPAAPLVGALWTRLQNAAIVPNIDGTLRPAADLRRAPVESPDLIKSWSRLAEPEACEIHVHATCTSTTARAGRLNQLATQIALPRGQSDGAARLAKTSLRDWLEFAASTDPEMAADTIFLADACAKSLASFHWDQIRDRACVILTADKVLAPASDVTFSDIAEPPFRPVHPLLVGHDAIRKILVERFHVRDLSEADWERLLDLKMQAAERSGNWANVWELLRVIPAGDLRECLDGRSICVCTRNGWHPSSQVFRSGKILDEDDVVKSTAINQSILKTVLLDEKWHDEDEAILLQMGVTDEPSKVWSSLELGLADQGPDARWFRTWQERGVAHYFSKLPNSLKPDRSYIRPLDVEMPSAWQLLLTAGEMALPRITTHFLATIFEAKGGKFGPVTFQHSTRTGAYPSEIYTHPLAALICEKGQLQNSGGQISVGSAISNFDSAKLLPSLRVLESALFRLKLDSDAKTVKAREQVWSELLEYAAYENVDANSLTSFWELAAAAGHAPRQVCTPNGPVPIASVRIATSVRDAKLACEVGVVAVGLTVSASKLWKAAGASFLDDESRLEWTPVEGGSEATFLLDVEPAIREALKPDVASNAAITFVQTLEKCIGKHCHTVDWAMQSGQLYIRRDAYFNSPWTSRIRLLLEAAEGGGWAVSGDPVDRVLRSGVDALRRAVAAAPDLSKKLLKAVGDPKVLFELFEADVQKQLSSDADRAATIALTLFGPALLTMPAIRDAMSLSGLQPPERWGSELAAEFVASIGFPALYSASPARKREPELLVSGPLQLNPLHDFQTEVVESLDQLFSDTTSKRRRAVISLPTGAGKTRVAAEWAVKRVLMPEKSNRLVLWVAQTDELCEQAVQCFREIWTNLGSSDDNLRVVRFWGGQANPQAPENGEPTVIVASIQTLSARLNDTELAWASNPGLLVIDECHHALTPSYTGFLKWFHPDVSPAEREPTIVGLSATPFRGRNEDESRQLARRFNGRLIPPHQSRLYDALQSRGVLAKLDYTRLEIDEKFELTAQEKQRLETFQTLPESALERLGENSARNDKILDAIVATNNRSALVFTTSVAHAQRLAARLNVMGMPAAAVSGETDRASRRWFIKAFLEGEVRVLCNHSALTTGFDAPATDLIVIARPVFSPSLYMQMVGRGMRGPVNGGKERCRILTVQDNLEQFTGKLAHHYFEQHYVAAGNSRIP